MIMTRKYPWLLPLLLSPLGLIVPLSPRSGPLFVLLLGLAGIAHCIRHRPSFDWLKTPPFYALAAFLSYLFLTSFWSTVPERSFEQASRLTLLALFGLAGFSLVRSLDNTQKHRVAECLIPAILVGIVTGCIYGLLPYTGGYIRILTDFLGLSPELSSFGGDNRLHIAKTMLLTNFAFFSVLPRLWNKNRIATLLAYGSFFMVCWNSDSQSAIVTCLAGGIAFLALQSSYRHSTKIILAAIVASFIIVIPITQSSLMEALKTEVRKTSVGAKVSFDHRLEIYRLFGKISFEKPLFGHGLTAGVKYKGDVPDTKFQSIYIGHRTPHNVHLQIIFDLGFTGAVLFLMSFIWPVWSWHRSDNYGQTFAALLVISLVLAGSLFNFVIWRSWIPGTAILAFYFLSINPTKTKLSDFR